MTRSVLRILLSRYTRQDPATISILTTRSGKPFALGEGMPDFSVSHSDGVAVIAFARSPLGVDVESIREIPEMLDIAEQFFSSRELRDLIASPPEQRPRIFFAAWTEKEAYLKATGQGLAGLPSDTDPPLGRQWQLFRFEREGYAVALVTTSPLSGLTFQKFVPELLG